MSEMKSETIYVVEDHEAILNGVTQYLELAGYEVKGLGDLKSAEREISLKAPDILIQDVMLPDGDGFMFVKKLKQICDIPVIFMTARGAESDRILGFELGADDYIVKPFSPKELVLRVQAVLRRVNMAKQTLPDIEELYTDQNGNLMMFSAKRHALEINGADVKLTAAEWRVLEYLISSDG